MVGFSSVDDSPIASELVRYLDRAALAETAIKHYVAAAHAQRVPRRPILDVGCGAGQDLVLLSSFGMTAVGVDPSALLVRTSRTRVDEPGLALVQGQGETLPFSDGVFSGCRIERVLMHVVNPLAILTEVVRCLEPNGLLTAFEPDWSRLEIESEILAGPAGWISGVVHPDIGGRLWHLVEQAGCAVLDRVEELSVWNALPTVSGIAGLPRAVERAVLQGSLEPTLAEQWLNEQTERHAKGEFRATMPKVLIVAEKVSVQVARR